MGKSVVLAVFGLAFLGLVGCGQQARGIDPTPRQPVVESHHGRQIVDEYRWLEDWSDPQVRQWTDAQQARGRQHLSDSELEQVRQEVTEARAAAAAEYRDVQWRRGRLFALKRKGSAAEVVMMPSVDRLDDQRVVAESESLGRIDGYLASLDGSRVAVMAGATVHLFETETGRKLDAAIENVHGGIAGIAWSGDGNGLYLLRRGDGEAGAPAIAVYFRPLADSLERYEIGREFPADATVRLATHHDGEYTLAQVERGAQFIHHLRGPEGWRGVTTYDRQMSTARFGGHELLYLLWHGRSGNGWVVTVPLWDPDLRNVEPVIWAQNPREVIANWVRTDNYLFVADKTGGVSDLRLFEFRGLAMGFVPLPQVSAVREMVHVGGDDLLVAIESYLSPRRWFHLTGTDVSPAPIQLGGVEPAEIPDVEVVREVATSKDGAKVPLTIVRPRGITLDGSNPTILAGYGGHGAAVLPWFEPARRVWLERGGIFAVAHIRGGSEFGTDWWKAGRGEKKQNAFDDFHAAMQRLKELGYTRTERLGIMSAHVEEDHGAGEVLVGAMIAQHPGEFAAAVLRDGPLDLVRAQQSGDAAAQARLAAEYGDIGDEAAFARVLDHSPYHALREGAKYPTVLFVGGEGDAGAFARKMAARLQAAGAAAWLVSEEEAVAFFAKELGNR